MRRCGRLHRRPLAAGCLQRCGSVRVAGHCELVVRSRLRCDVPDFPGGARGGGHGAARRPPAGADLRLAIAGLDAGLPEGFAWIALLVEGLDLLAWAWVLYAVPAAARRFLDGESGPQSLARPIGPRHPVVSGFIVCVLALQVSALFRSRPTLWPFIDYPLYSAAQTTAVRAIHYRLYGVPSQGPPTYVEITAEALGMSWFVYHTELIPRLFNRPGSVPAQLRRALEDADLPPFRRIEAERTTFMLADPGTIAFPERRPVEVGSTAADREAPERVETPAAPAAGTRPR